MTAILRLLFALIAWAATLQAAVSPVGTGAGTAAQAEEPASAPPAVRLIAAFGDTGVTVAAATNVHQAAAAGSEGFLGLGDYDYDAGPAAWRRQMAPLLRGGCLCVLGNHDDRAAYLPLLPDGGATWSLNVAGVRLIGLDTNRSLAVGSAQWRWLEAALEAAPEPLKVVTMHAPWWLRPGAFHPAAEFPGNPQAMEDLMVRHGVVLVLAGHEHNYQRSVRDGVTYAVVGTGGRALYPLRGPAPGTEAAHYGYGHLLLTLSERRIQAVFVDLDGVTRDTFIIEAP
jgi:hypothetical protein